MELLRDKVGPIAFSHIRQQMMIGEDEVKNRYRRVLLQLGGEKMCNSCKIDEIEVLCHFCRGGVCVNCCRGNSEWKFLACKGQPIQTRLLINTPPCRFYYWPKVRQTPEKEKQTAEELNVDYMQRYWTMSMMERRYR